MMPFIPDLLPLELMQTTRWTGARVGELYLAGLGWMD